MAGLLFVILGFLGHAHELRLEGGESALATWILGHERLLLGSSVVIFALAAISDYFDGYVARRWDLHTDFGRIVDPFADKVMVCGSFVLLIPIQGSHVAPWMVVVILSRELLVDGLRGFAESRGVAFPSMWAGKVKMFVQSVAIGWVLLSLAFFPQAAWGSTLALVLVIGAVVSTLYSGLGYVYHARKVLGSDSISTLASDEAPALADAPSAPSEPVGGRS